MPLSIAIQAHWFENHHDLHIKYGTFARGKIHYERLFKQLDIFIEIHLHFNFCV